MEVTHRLCLKIICVFIFHVGVECLQCLDKNGNKVDWFIVYKLPKIHGSKNPNIAKGVAHMYMDVNNPEWELSPVSMEDTKHAVAFTLKQIYNNHKSNEVAYAMYNDEKPPEKTSTNKGHTKGDLAFNKEGGFWLVHSVPLFPPYSNESYSYPETGTHYGQSFLCISLDYEHFNNIGKQLHYTYPQIYDYNMPTSFKADNQDLLQAFQAQHVKEAPWYRIQKLVSKGGQTFQSFAKFGNFNAEMYAVWLAPYFESEMYVESWQNGPGKLPSNCSGDYNVYNVHIFQPEGMGLNFTESKDHSKWAVTADRSWTCIGGINREEKQEVRAGGTVCFDIPAVWQAFCSSIKELVPCEGGRRGRQGNVPQCRADKGIPWYRILQNDVL